MRQGDHARPASYVYKRVFDLVLAGIALVLALPVIAIVALAVRGVLGSPVLFRQTRPGLCGKPFTIFKFRTMRNTIDANGNLLGDGERLTAFGRFLRSTSVDELPELFNVMRGDMSLVGPRPLLMEYLDRYSDAQMRRHDVKPGITGWAQIHGRNTLSWDERFDLDIWYVDHQSIRLDLTILGRTAAKVFSREGINAAGHVTMPEFRGSASSNAEKRTATEA
jgi:lipopolysaccharide/colanic/teichoic acid biosynthesis glycosyltransferase